MTPKGRICAAPALLACLLLAFGCRPANIFKRYQKTLVVEDSGNVVYFVHDTGAPPEGYDHPMELSSAAVRTLLGSMKMQVYAVIQWKHPFKVFDPGELRFLGPAISKAVEQAGRDDMIYWKLCRPDRGYGSEITGRFYICRDAANVIVDVARGQRWDPSATLDEDALNVEWRLKPGQHQQYYMRRAILGPVPVENHIVMAVDKLPLIGMGLDQVGADIKQRLIKLKELYDAGAITAEDYDREKKRLLEDL